MLKTTPHKKAINRYKKLPINPPNKKGGLIAALIL
tara:strand:- start:390 stop:494 length:105 start_codon:yes stop_codon:yes gene_type:complete